MVRRGIPEKFEKKVQNETTINSNNYHSTSKISKKGDVRLNTGYMSPDESSTSGKKFSLNKYKGLYAINSW